MASPSPNSMGPPGPNHPPPPPSLQQQPQQQQQQQQQQPPQVQQPPTTSQPMPPQNYSPSQHPGPPASPGMQQGTQTFPPPGIQVNIDWLLQAAKYLSDELVPTLIVRCLLEITNRQIYVLFNSIHCRVRNWLTHRFD